jgi:hypothetical protein
MYSQIKNLTMAEVSGAINNLASETHRLMAKQKEFYDFILSLSTADLTAIGYDESTRTIISSFRVALLNMNEAYNNTAKTGSAKPADAFVALKNPITC